MIKSAPRISLCMIVRDEEQYLDECLKSVKPYVDEMVIVDTGSRDSTVEIARSNGADVSFFEWNDSFADARNEYLRHATGEWVIYLDADERLNSLDEADCLRKTASAEGVDAYSVPIVSHKTAAGRADFDVNYNIRMFRKLPGIHFVNEVLERVEPFLQKAGATVGRSSFLIEHVGYNIDSSAMNKKIERNLALSRKQLERDPDDAYALYYLGSALLRFDEKEESRQALERALLGKGLTCWLEALILNLLGFLYFSEHQYDLALAKAKASVTALPHQYTGGLLLGLIYYHRQQYELALEHLVPSHRFFSLPAEQQKSELSQEFLLLGRADLIKTIALCHLGCKDFARAASFFREYIAYCPEDSEIFRMLALCCLNAEDYPASLVYLRRAERLGIDPAAIAVPLAYAHYQAGNPQEAMRYFLHADGEREADDTPALKLLEHLAMGTEGEERYSRVFHQQKPLLQRTAVKKLSGLANALASAGRHDLLLDLCHWIDLRGEQGEQLLMSIVEQNFENNRVPGLIGFLEQLLRDYPEYPRVLDALGVACIKVGDFSRAISVHRQLLGVCPENREILRRLAGLYLTVGDMESAHGCLEGSLG